MAARRSASASATSIMRAARCAWFARNCAAARALRSTITTRAAPRDAASKPSAPLPANRSRQRWPSRRWPSQLKSVSRTRSGVGRRPSRSSTGSGVRFQSPPMMRIVCVPPTRPACAPGFAPDFAPRAARAPCGRGEEDERGMRFLLSESVPICAGQTPRRPMRERYHRAGRVLDLYRSSAATTRQEAPDKMTCFPCVARRVAHLCHVDKRRR
ncbi:hypothetical protein PSAC2689_40478 [Paraburkholderia sacchari]